MTVSRWTNPFAILLGLVAVAAATQPTQFPSPAQHQPPPDATWTADAVVDQATFLTDTKLGAGQGVSIHAGKIYAYGDVWSVKPRVGVIREYDLELKPTGREVWLRKGGQPLILHPTGLTWDDQSGTFLGDTVNKKARIYQLDWERAWRDGNLDSAVLSVVEDDAAINGCRPEFVSIGDRKYLATADYGDIRPEIRLMDPISMVKAGRTSAPGVVIHRILAGAWNQNLSWDGETGQLTCVENVIEGRGWRLDTINLANAVRDGRVEGPGVRVDRFTFDPHDELEGYCTLDRNRRILITSGRAQNIVVGVLKHVELHPTLPPPTP